jgi:uncharacterized membrane protein
MTGAKQALSRGARPWMKGLLAVSLALNLLVLGVIVGARVDDHARRPDHRSGESRGAFDPALGPFSRALPDPYRSQAVEDLRERAGDIRDNRAVLAAQVDEMIALLRDDEFDQAALRAVLEAQSEAFRARGQVGRDVVLEQISRMSARDRALLAERLEKGFRRAMDRARP